MLSVSSLLSAVEGQFDRTDEPPAQEDDEDPGLPEGPQAALFQCPDCESVYVAIDKRTCTACETAVERVPSTLHRTA